MRHETPPCEVVPMADAHRAARSADHRPWRPADLDQARRSRQHRDGRQQAAEARISPGRRAGAGLRCHRHLWRLAVQPRAADRRGRGEARPGMPSGAARRGPGPLRGVSRFGQPAARRAPGRQDRAGPARRVPGRPRGPPGPATSAGRQVALCHSPRRLERLGLPGLCRLCVRDRRAGARARHALHPYLHRLRIRRHACGAARRPAPRAVEGGAARRPRCRVPRHCSARSSRP